MPELDIIMNSAQNELHSSDDQAEDLTDERMSTGAGKVDVAQLEEEGDRRNIR